MSNATSTEKEFTNVGIYQYTDKEGKFHYSFELSTDKVMSEEELSKYGAINADPDYYMYDTNELGRSLQDNIETLLKWCNDCAFIINDTGVVLTDESTGEYHEVWCGELFMLIADLDDDDPDEDYKKRVMTLKDPDGGSWLDMIKALAESNYVTAEIRKQLFEIIHKTNKLNIKNSPV